MKTETASKGRALSAFVERILAEIGNGRYARGSFIPPTRTLAELYDTSAETARRGLKLLESQGVLVAEGRAGFRVAQVEDDRTVKPVAFITSHSPLRPETQPATAALFLAMQAAGARRGWPILGAHGGTGSADSVTNQLLGSRCWGAILDTINEELYAAVVRCGLPTVMVNSWVEDSPISTVLQDNYRGGFLAAEYLLAQGAKRIAWVGPVSAYCHSRERFAGASACLRAAGIDIEQRDCLEPREKLDAGKVAALLRRSDRPEGILALGLLSSAAVKEAADELGLTIGRDFELVSWVAEECYEGSYLPIFRGGAAAPAVVWSGATMAERALALLADVGDGLIGEPVRLCVPTKLKFDGETQS
ncbi:MAG: substrate-binding domain-containing protein [Planctomycetota bacterium]